MTAQPVPPPADCGTFDIGCHIGEGVNNLFRGIVEAALNPLLRLPSDTLLTTPTLSQLPQVGPMWDVSWRIVVASYGTLILIGGIVVMSYESLQTRYTLKEIAPRLVVGFLAAFFSLPIAEQAILLANALSHALLSGGLDADSTGGALQYMVTGALSGGGLFLLLLGLALAVMLVALLITYILRVAITVILLIGAPLALMCHALPHTETIARWWWKAFAGVLAIQVAQSLTLIVALKVFFEPTGWTPFGPRPSGLVNLLVALALVYVLLKIPFWILSATRTGGGRSFVGSLMRGWIAYKAFGLLRGGQATSPTATASGPQARPGPAPRGGERNRRPGHRPRHPCPRPVRPARTRLSRPRPRHPSNRPRGAGRSLHGLARPPSGRGNH